MHFSEIKTKRLQLRKLKETDWEMIFYLRSDDMINKFIERPRAESKKDALDFIAKTNESIDKGEAHYWCISEIDKQKMIGSICLWNFSEDGKIAEVGYELSPEFQGKGIMSEALERIIKFGFNNLKLESIIAYTHKNNNNSIRLLIKNNFNLIKEKKDGHNIYGIKKAGS